jgi:hypothetical protein
MNLDLPDELRRAIPGRLRADREARPADQVRRRAARLPGAVGGGRRDGPEPAGDAAPLPADGDRGGGRAELDPGDAVTIDLLSLFDRDGDDGRVQQRDLRSEKSSNDLIIS